MSIPRCSLLLLCLPLLLTACGEEELPTRDELFQMEQELPAPYLALQSGELIEAPGDKPAFYNEDTGEHCYRAQACHNPDCPGRGPDGQPFLFVVPLPYKQADGAIAQPDVSAAKAAHNVNRECPQCLTIRNKTSEPAELTQKYINWVKMHELPETVEKRAEIAELRLKVIEFERRRPTYE